MAVSSKIETCLCPNGCGEFYKRGDIEEHRRSCHMEEITCEFINVGCREKFVRNKKEEHNQEYIQQHLQLVSSHAITTRRQHEEHKLQSEIENSKNSQDTKKLVEEQAEEISELKKSLKEQAEKLKESEEKLKQQEKRIVEMEEGKRKWQDTEDKLTKQTQYNEENDTKIKIIEEKLPKLMDMSSYLGNFERTFKMRNFSVEKDRDKHRDWKSPAMYTHLCGYKFCVGLDANGRDGSQGKAIYAELYVMPGEYDSLLKWPAKASFTLELINRHADGKNTKYSTAMKKWEKPESSYKCLSNFPLTELNNSSYCFLEHSKLDEFLEEDTLKFCTNVTLH